MTKRKIYLQNCFEDGLPAKYYVTKKQINDFFKEFSYENRWNFLIKYANRIPQFSNKPKLIKIGEINE